VRQEKCRAREIADEPNRNKAETCIRRWPFLPGEDHLAPSRYAIDTGDADLHAVAIGGENAVALRSTRHRDLFIVAKARDSHPGFHVFGKSERLKQSMSLSIDTHTHSDVPRSRKARTPIALTPGDRTSLRCQNISGHRGIHR